jgi:hypothetical protein
MSDAILAVSPNRLRIGTEFLQDFGDGGEALVRQFERDVHDLQDVRAIRRIRPAQPRIGVIDVEQSATVIIRRIVRRLGCRGTHGAACHYGGTTAQESSTEYPDLRGNG